jgi:Putative sugar-binding domain
VPINSSEEEWLRQVAIFAAKHLNSLIHSEMVVGLAWGTTIDAISRASGPDLSLFKRTKHALCVISGLGKAPGLRAALRGGLMSELIVDEPTARALLWPENDDVNLTPCKGNEVLLAPVSDFCSNNCWHHNETVANLASLTFSSRAGKLGTRLSADSIEGSFPVPRQSPALVQC